MLGDSTAAGYRRESLSRDARAQLLSPSRRSPAGRYTSRASPCGCGVQHAAGAGRQRRPPRRDGVIIVGANDVTHRSNPPNRCATGRCRPGDASQRHPLSSALPGPRTIRPLAQPLRYIAGACPANSPPRRRSRSSRPRAHRVPRRPARARCSPRAPRCSARTSSTRRRRATPMRPTPCCPRPWTPWACAPGRGRPARSRPGAPVGREGRRAGGRTSRYRGRGRRGARRDRGTPGRWPACGGDVPSIRCRPRPSRRDPCKTRSCRLKLSSLPPPARRSAARARITHRRPSGRPDRADHPRRAGQGAASVRRPDDDRRPVPRVRVARR